MATFMLIFGTVAFGCLAFSREKPFIDTQGKRTVPGRIILVFAGGAFLTFFLAGANAFLSSVEFPVVSPWQSFQRAVLIIVLVPLLYVAAVAIVDYGGSIIDEKSRNNYIDALKTLTAASGISMAVISVGIQRVDPCWMWVVQRAAIYLTVCAVSSLTTLFWLSLAYDWARSKGVAVPLKVLSWLLVLAYIALTTFGLGLAYTARITYHIRLTAT
jgi:hypothetical protein